MRIAVFADIHANRQAFAACLAQAREFGAEGTVLLGDYVGYGADPEWTVATVMELVDNGAVAVRGNHDNALVGREAAGLYCRCLSRDTIADNYDISTINGVQFILHGYSATHYLPCVHL